MSNSTEIELFRLMSASRALDRVYGAHDGHWHGLEGEEAAACGAYYGLRPSDVLAPHYRGAPLAAYAKGADLETLFKGMMAKRDGYNRGRHRNDVCPPPELNLIGLFTGSLGPPLAYATGAALAAKLDGRDDVAVAVFGDGVSSRGDCHEAMNLASVQALPVIFVCQNNQIAISTRAATGVAGKIADRAAGYAMPGVQVDGNDVLAVRDAMDTAIARARAGAGPSLIEALTYRVSGHFYSDAEDYRDPQEIARWREKDPIARLRRHIVGGGIATEDELDRMAAQIQAEIAETFEKANAAPDPGEAEFGGEAAVFAPVQTRETA
ncbi:MAG: thiamine pyrophosphate-dependent dehydrogenase E1 component subunit alpha [Oceanicaulis sp.]